MDKRNIFGYDDALQEISKINFFSFAIYLFIFFLVRFEYL